MSLSLALAIDPNQLDGEDVVQVVRPYTPKELAIQYHRQLNRRRWEEDPSLLGRS
jgi:hypothetical protein